jgi:hypothetical protein
MAQSTHTHVCVCVCATYTYVYIFIYIYRSCRIRELNGQGSHLKNECRKINAASLKSGGLDGNILSLSQVS